MEMIEWIEIAVQWRDLAGNMETKTRGTTVSSRQLIFLPSAGWEMSSSLPQVGEGIVWLTGVVVYLQAALESNWPLTQTVDSRIASHRSSVPLPHASFREYVFYVF